MAQLVVRGLEKELVPHLKERAVAHGVSAEEEHRRILRQALNEADVKGARASGERRRRR
jgi:plasmid stability protein